MPSKRIACYAALAIALPAFAYGPLFPWSPIHPGHDELRLARVRVLYPSGVRLPEAYAGLDGMLADAEEFHGYTAHANINVVDCDSWMGFWFRNPWLWGARPGAATLLTGVTPRLAELGRDHGEFLRHELSHAVLAQNGAIANSFRLSKQEWIYEGIAVWPGRQRSYVSQDEFFARAQRDGVAIHLGPPNPASNRVEIRYRYVVWRNFLDYLDRQHGRTDARRCGRFCMRSIAMHRPSSRASSLFSERLARTQRRSSRMRFEAGRSNLARDARYGIQATSSTSTSVCVSGKIAPSAVRAGGSFGKYCA